MNRFNKNTIINIINTSFVAVFIIAIFFNFVQASTAFIPDIESTENRTLSTCPDLLKEDDMGIRRYLKKIISFPEAYNSCFQDKFALRNTVISEMNTQRLKNFDISPSKDVIKGSDGWFEFYDPLVKNYIENGFQDGEIVYWHDQILARQKYFESKGIKYYTFIVPLKINLLKDYFPQKYTDFPKTGALKLETYNQQNGSKLNLHLLHETLKNNPEQYYYKSDFHWNLEGGFEGYKKIYNELSTDEVKMNFTDKKDCKQEIIPEYTGDLAKLAGIGDTAKVDQYKDKNTTYYVCDQRKINFDNLVETFGNTPDKSFVNRNTDNKLDNILFLRDSFTTYISPFLLPSFNKVDLVYSPSFFENGAFESIEEKKPDVVVQIFVESNMRRGSIKNNQQIDDFWKENRCLYIQC